MNLLFTSAGRRGYLIRYFKDELGGRGLVHAANSSNINSAFLDADQTVTTPLIYDERYISFLMDYCLKYSIKAIIPLFDIDLPVLASNKCIFDKAGVTLVASSVDVTKICNDKWETYKFLKMNGFNAPQTYISIKDAEEALSKDKMRFPVILKPRWGMGSIGLYMAESVDELRIFYDRVERDIERSYLKYESFMCRGATVLLQEMLNGQEYGLDIINDLNGFYATTFVKRKIAMRSGETDVAVTVNSELLLDLGKSISFSLRHLANLDVDVFLVDEKAYVIEMNARFGGGYPFSHLAGANLPKAILSWIEGKPADTKCFLMREGVIGMKAIQPCVLK